MPEIKNPASGLLPEKRRLLPAFISAVITLAVYYPSLQNGFVNWDDNLYVYYNQGITRMDAPFFRWIFTSVIVNNYHPLTMISYALDYSYWGLNPYGYHLVNIVIHALNTFLVFILAFRLARAARPEEGGSSLFPSVAAAVTALLFGLHPLHVESVSWVSERKDVLSGLFFIASMLAYLGYAGPPASKRAVYYAGSLLLFILALLSKPMAITLPAVLLILDFYPLRRLSRKDAGRLIAEKLPFFALSAASAFMTLWAQKVSGAVVSMKSYPLVWRVLVAMKACMFYVYKMLLPMELAPFYPMPSSRAEFLTPGTIALIALFVIAAAFCAFSLKRTKALCAAWLYYLVTLSPVIGVIQVGEQAAADRYAYLPSLGLFLLAGAAAGVFLEKMKKEHLAPAAAGALALIFIILSVITVTQEAVWSDSVSLWSHQIEIFPGKAPRAYSNRGVAFAEQGRLSEAIDDFSTAITLDPRFEEAYTNRGIANKESGRLKEAVRDLLAAVDINPSFAPAYQGLGLTFEAMGDGENAAIAYRRARELGYRQ